MENKATSSHLLRFITSIFVEWESQLKMIFDYRREVKMCYLLVTCSLIETQNWKSNTPILQYEEMGKREETQDLGSVCFL